MCLKMSYNLNPFGSAADKRGMDKMETLAALILILIVLANAVSFFDASSRQKRLYKETAEDTQFNKSAHQNA